MKAFTRAQEKILQQQAEDDDDDELDRHLAGDAGELAELDDTFDVGGGGCDVADDTGADDGDCAADRSPAAPRGGFETPAPCGR